MKNNFGWIHHHNFFVSLLLFRKLVKNRLIGLAGRINSLYEDVRRPPTNNTKINGVDWLRSFGYRKVFLKNKKVTRKTNHLERSLVKAILQINERLHFGNIGNISYIYYMLVQIYFNPKKYCCLKYASGFFISSHENKWGKS